MVGVLVFIFLALPEKGARPAGTATEHSLVEDKTQGAKRELGSLAAAASASGAPSGSLHGEGADANRPPSDHGQTTREWAVDPQPTPSDSVVEITGGASLRELRVHQSVQIPLTDGQTVSGRVNLIREERDGVIRIGGNLTDGTAGSFSVGGNRDSLNGRILVPGESVAYIISRAGAAGLEVRKLPLAEIICHPLPAEPEPSDPSFGGGGTGAPGTPPLLSSRSAAAAVAYLDFDGETVSDPDWNSGSTIVAAPANLTNAQIIEIWSRVKEDFLPFDLDITTDPNRYNAAPPGGRMRVIVTPTNTAAPGSGGVAYVGSFAAAGAPYSYFASDIPCWVFNSSVDGVAEAISHEVGHTLGLRHDGRNPPLSGSSSSTGTYYYGHGDSGSAVGWAPIMGAGYYRKLVQWSKGEYPGANNQEDDVAILAGEASFNLAPEQPVTNTLGHSADEAGDTRPTALTADASSGAFSHTGVITTAADADFYAFTTTEARTVTLSAQPASTYLKEPNLDVLLELQDSGGTVLVGSNPDGALSASLSAQVPAGTYYVKIAGAGRVANGTDYGYSNYGSLGQYSLSASFDSPIPDVTSPGTATTGVGHWFTYTITAIRNPTSFGATGLPVGLSFDSSTGEISGRPTALGVFTIGLSAINPYGTGTATLTLTVTEAAPAVFSQTSELQVLSPGGDATLAVSGFSANGSISHQWMHDGRPVGGATSPTFPITAATAEAGGAYWLELSNSVGTTRSSPIFVRVAPAVTKVRAWGANNDGQTSVPAGLGRVIDVATGSYHSLALKADGTVAVWGRAGSAPAGLSGVVAVAGGYDYSAALKSDGTVTVWSTSSSWNPSVLNVPVGLKDVVAIAAGGNHMLALRTDGTVVAWGENYSGKATVPTGLAGVVAVAAGSVSSLALKADGSVVAWGDSGYGGQVPVGLAGVTAIDVGGYGSIALKAGGTTVAWGSGAIPAPEIMPTAKAVVATPSGYFSLNTDGTVVTWGGGVAATIPADLGSVLRLSAISNHALALCDGSTDVAPAITVAPSSVLRAVGTKHTFSVTASGPGVFAYQWRRNGSAITGAAGPTLTLAAIQLADAGNYDVVVSNHAGATTSSGATLTVEAPPAVTAAPNPRLLAPVGQPLTLSVAATSANGPLTYQWKKNNRPISGATSATYSLGSFSNVDAGAYTLETTDAHGLVTRTTTFVLPAYDHTQVRIWGSVTAAQRSVVPALGDVLAASMGNQFSLFLRADGTVTALGTYGYNSYASYLAVPAGLSDVVAISAGYYHALALRADGTVVAWGDNYAGRATVPSGLSGIIAVIAGESVSFALGSDGTVTSLGADYYSSIKQVPANLSEVTAVSVGSSHVLALRADGTVVAWGSNGSGQTTIPSGLNDVVAVAAGSNHSLALRADGTVVAWGSNYSGETAVPVGLTGVVAVAAGGNASMALKTDGTVVAWSENIASNSVARVPVGLADVVAIAAGASNGLALRNAFADSSPSITQQPTSLATIAGSYARFAVVAGGTDPFSYQWRKNGADIAGATSASLSFESVQPSDAGNYSVVVTNHLGSATSVTATLAIETGPVITSAPPARRVGTPGLPLTLSVGATSAHGPLTYQWKKNNRPIAGATGATYTLAGFTNAAAGAYTVEITDAHGVVVRATTFVLPSFGPTQMRTWGDSQLTGVPAGVGDAIALTAGDSNAFALRSSGAVVGWGASYNGMLDIPAGLADVVAVSAGSSHALALRADGTVSGWGNSNYEQTTVPAALANVIAIAAGGTHSFALKSDGRLVNWGSGSYWLGGIPADLEPVSAIAIGNDHVLALQVDGTVASWGSSNYGATSVPVGLSDVIAVAAGAYHSLALKADGTVIGWGRNSNGQAAVPAGLANVVAIAARGDKSMALTADGTVIGWGSSYYGESNIPTDLGTVVAIASASGSSLALRSAAGEPPPVITQQPQAPGLKATGDQHTFVVAATGTGPLGYQWRRNGAPISGATSDTFILSSIQSGDAGNYDVVVSSYAGSVTSNPVALTVENPPALSGTPVLKTAGVPGSPLTLAFSATSAQGPLTYQWKRNNQPIAGATAASYTIPSFANADAGAYTLEITDAHGLVTRATVFVLSTLPPTLVRAWGVNQNGQLSVPIDSLRSVISVSAGSSHTLALLADGTVRSWGQNYNGQINVPAGLIDVVAVAAGAYHSLALKRDGTVVAWGSGNYAVPAGLKGVIAIAAGDYSSALKSDGTVVTWNSSGTIIPMGVVGQADITAIALGSNHLLALRLDGTVVGWTNTNYTSAQIAATPPTQLRDVLAIGAGYDQSIALKADGSVVAWGSNRNAVAIGPGGATAIESGTSFALARLTDGSLVAWGGYNNYGERNVPTDLGAVLAFSAGGDFAVAVCDNSAGQAPVITQHPQSVVRFAGSSHTFTVAATSAFPLSYQWRKDGVNVTGATGAALTLPALQPGDAGGYDVLVSNLVGTVASQTAVLTLGTAPAVISAPPTRLTGTPGSPLSLTVAAASANGPLSYQWKKNNRILAGATGAVYSISSFANSDAGAYTLEITDAIGMVRRVTSFVLPSYSRTQLRGWSSSSSPHLTPPPAVADALGVAVGGSHALALRANGTVIAWGSNPQGQTTVPDGLTNAVAVAAGQEHSLALRADGTVVAWGGNSSGQASVPAGLVDVISVAAAGHYSAALKSDGTVVAWGYNGSGQTTIPSGLRDVVALAASAYHLVALRSDGSVVAWGTDSYYGNTTVPASLGGVTAIGAGDTHSLAVTAAGSVVAWGYNGYGQTSVPAGLSNAVAVAGGSSHSLALSANGTVTAWGNNNSGQAAVPEGLSGVFAISVGSVYNICVRDASSDGLPVVVTQPQSQSKEIGVNATFAVVAGGPGPFAYQWRKNGVPIAGATLDQLTVPAVTTVDNGSYDVVVSNHVGSVTSAAASLAVHPAPAFASVPPARLVAPIGQPQTLTVTVTGGTAPFTYQWWKDNRPVAGATGSSYTIPSVSPATTGAYTLVVTDAHGLTKRTTSFVLPGYADTQVRAWGANASGQLIVPAGLSDVIALSAGSNHTLALRTDGTVAAWGGNGYGQTAVPTGLNNAVAVAAGNQFSLALKSDGTVVRWGSNSYSLPAGLNGVIAIAAGGSALALKSDGTVVPLDSSATSPAGLTDVVAIAAGDSHYLALKSDGTVVAWGNYSYYGQTNVPAGLSGVVAIFAGGNQSAALKADGRLVLWGENANSLALGEFRADGVELGNNFGLLLNQGKITGWGSNGSGQRTIPYDLGHVVSVSAGGDFSVALRDAAADTPPVITTHPASTVAALGRNHTFGVSAVGQGPFAYQWRRNGVAISGATSAALTLTNLQAADAGNYDVVVSNSGGSVTSNLATLILEAPPAIVTAPPGRFLATNGQTVTLSVSASSANGPLSYQWKRNNRPIPGATAATITLPSFSWGDAGAYTLEITDAHGLVTRATTFVLPNYSRTQIYAWGSNNAEQTNVPEYITDALQVEAGGGNSAALRSDGSVVVWGSSYYNKRNVPADLGGVVDLSIGESHVLALRSDGKVVAWGDNSQSQSTVPLGLGGVISVSAGHSHSLALRSDGVVVAWGHNGYEQSKVPPGLSDVVGISAGNYHYLALRLDGTVTAWGANSHGQTIMPAGLIDVVAVAAGGNHSLALKADGTVVAWGYGSYGQTTVPAGLDDVVAIAADGNISMALKSDGSVVVWGESSYGLTTVPTGLGTVVDIAAGQYHALALRDASADPLPAISTQPQNAVAALGGSHSFTVVATGVGPLTYQWRRNGSAISGATSSSYTRSGLQSADAGSYDVVVTNLAGSVTSAAAILTIEAPPTVTSAPNARIIGTPGATLNLAVTAASANAPLTYQWTKNNRAIAGATASSHTIPNFSNADAGAYTLEITDAHGLVTRRTTFVLPGYAVTQVRAWGNNSNKQLDVPTDLGDVIALSAGGYHTLALRSNGTVVAWGYDGSGRATVPSGLTEVVAVAAGGAHSLALRKDGTVVAWGYNGSGQATVPVGLKEVIAIAAGGDSFSVALRSDGTVVTWGYDGSGQTTVSAGLIGVSAVATGSNHTLALKTDGTVVAWGSNSYNASVVPAGLGGVVAIAAGGSQSLALRSNGQIVVWGSSYEAVPGTASNPIAIGGRDFFSLALRSDGSLVGWGSASYGQLNISDDLVSVLAFSAGGNHVVALRDASGDELPLITAQPQSAAGALGGRHTFEVKASGVGPFSYQWYKDRAAIPGATSASLALTPLTSASAGTYHVVVSNINGSRGSAPAVLTVAAPPVFTVRPPARQLFAPGSSLTLTASATSANGPLAYQWKKDNRPIAGATGPSLVLASYSPAAAGAYTLEVTDTLGLVIRTTSFVLPGGVPTQVLGWGNNDYGQLTVPPDLNDAVAISAGDGHSLALRADGRIVGWGGSGSSAIAQIPVGLTNVVAVASGYSHRMALRSDHSVFVWGYSSYGIDTPPADVGEVIALATGESHALALRSDGTVIAWGANYYGQCNVPSGLDQVVAIAAAGSTSHALRLDGTVVSWGNNAPLPPVGLTGVEAMAAGSGHVLARKNDGTAVAWGSNSYAESAIPAGLTGVAGIAAGGQFSAVWKSDGTVVAWGYNYDGRTTVPTGLDDVQALAVGSRHVLALRAAGADAVPTVTSSPASQNVGAGASVSFSVTASGAAPLRYQWRKNGVAIGGATSATLALVNVQPVDAGNYDVVVSNHVGSVTSNAAVFGVGVPPTIGSASARRLLIAPGQPLNISVAATTADGPLSYQWKRNNRPIAGATSATYSVASFTPALAGAYTVEVSDAVGRVTRHTSFVLPAYAATQLVVWGSNSYNLSSVPAGLNGVVAVTAGGSHNVVLKSDGTVSAWGNPYSDSSTVPVGLTDVVGLSAGSNHTLALRADGTVIGWGYNGYGQTTAPAGLTGVIAVAAGDSFSMALKSDGTVVGWGNNGSGQTSVPTGLGNVVAIAASSSYSVAVKADGTVVAWGDNSYAQTSGAAAQTGIADVSAGNYGALALSTTGTVSSWGANYYSQLNVPGGLGSVRALAAGYNHSVALKSDGTVSAWGSNSYGETTVPAGLSGVVAIAAGSYRTLALRDASADSAPTITTQPQGASVSAGGGYAFSVVASGPGTLAYQWRKGGVAIAGATSATLTLSAVATTDSGNYDVAVSNHVGTTVSGGATLTVNPVPAISAQNARRTMLSPGQPFSLFVTATGNGALSYQWHRNGLPIPGATAATLNVSGAARSDTGYYFCTITDSLGTARSAPSWVLVAPAVTQVVSWGDNDYYKAMVPADLADAVSLAVGGDHSLAIRRDGTLTAWGYSGYLPPASATLGGVVGITAGSSNTLTLHSDGTVRSWGGQTAVPAGLGEVVAIAASYYGGYTLALRTDGTVAQWNSSGTLASVPAAVQDVSAIAAGSSHYLALKKDGTVVAWGGNSYGETTVPTGLAGVTAVAAGWYHSLALKSDGTVVAWGANGDGQSTVPTGLTGVVAIAADAYASFALKSDGTVVAWGSNSRGQTTVPSGLGAVWSLFSGGLGRHALALRDASGDVPPAITAQPQGAVWASGQTWTFAVSATGAGPLSYQWRRAGTAISGATSATFTLGNLQPGDAGSYDVVVSNLAGSTASAVASLVVETPPTITSAPAARIIGTPGSPINLSISATSANLPLTYQWKKDNRIIPGATSASYSLPSFTNAAAGAYTLVITDSHGISAYSTTFVLPAYGTVQIRGWGANYNGQINVPPGIGSVVGMAAGNSFAGAIKADGGVVTWGYNGYGNTVPTGVGNVVRLALGYYHALSLKSDGTVVAWGSTSSGQTNIPLGLADVIKVAAGYDFSVALKADGTVVAWGSNSYGQTTVPAGLTDVVAITAGQYHAVALKADGTVVAWGYNYHGQATVPVGLTGVSAITVGSNHTLALKSDGTVLAWGDNGSGQIATPAGLAGVVAIAAGSHTSYALKADSSIAVWGQTYYGPSQAPADLGLVYRLAAGGEFALALRDATGDVAPSITAQPISVQAAPGRHVTFNVTAAGSGPLTYQWRKDGVTLGNQTGSSLNLYSINTSSAGSYDVVVSNHIGSVTSSAASLELPVEPSIAPISAHRTQGRVGQSLSLTTTATGSAPLVYRWKKNNRPIVGATAATFTLASFTNADAGAYTIEVTDATGRTARQTFFVLPDYTITEVRGWGANTDGQATPPADLRTALAISAGELHSVAYRSDGAVVAWGHDGYSQSTVPDGLDDIVAVAAGGYHTLALESDGTVMAWGANNHGQAVVPSGLNEVIAVAAGHGHSLALKSDGTISSWGFNTWGAPSGSFVAIAAGGYHSLAVGIDGTVSAWGDSTAGQTTVPSGLTDVVSVAAGYYHSAALKSDGTVVAWGRNTSGQATVPAGLTGVVGLFADANYCLAWKSDGSAVFWGDTTGGLSPAPVGLGASVAFAAGGGHALALLDKTDGSGPAITAQPQGATVPFASSQMLNVTAVGPGVLAYQWKKNGVVMTDGASVSGTATTSLAFDSFSAFDVATYTVTVSNSFGSVTSEPAILVSAQDVQTITFASLADRGFTTTPIPLAATASSELPVTFTVVAGSATISGTSLTLIGTGLVTVRAEQAGNAIYAAAPPVERSFTVTANFNSWSRGKFTTGELLDADVSGPNADPDGDGYSNLIEYALGLEPKAPSTTGLPEMSTTATDWVYTYTRPADRADLAYVVEVSTDLASWTTGGVTHELVSTSGGIETWRGKYPLASASNVFFRLRATGQ